MDANEHVLDGPLCTGLTGLGFTPAAHSFYGKLPNTHVNGSECIDEVWVSHGVEVLGVQVLSFHQSVGDHRGFIIDISTRSAIGLYAHLVVRPDCRRLTTKNRQCLEKYLEIVEEQWKIHRVNERLEYLTYLCHSYPAPPHVIAALERLDKQIEEIFKHAENNCRKIAKIDGEFSIPAKYWHEKMVSIKALKRRLLHKTRNDGNICRTARRHNISHPRQYTSAQLDQLYRMARDRKNNIRHQTK
jgi:hypothetical protein